MNTKRIWIIALIFGTLSATLFMIFISNSTNDLADVENEDLLSEEMEQEFELEKEQQSLLEIEEGNRAMSVSVNDVQGVSGFIRSGDYVDIISHLPSIDEGIPMAQLLLQNVRVLSVGRPQVFGEEYASYGTVTLEVTPEEGVALSLSVENGYIVFMLRGEGDNEVERMKKITIEQLQ
ncbi:Flp pilus assembly protein CpaB [Evansella sp. AB-P1]|uniref:Flp pilus assembly protein CpaB n=1 Tax=Evansella sp. AB-P1 TaxID=3037653 RepID=UPI002420074C|nr:Flp pilus assembly protein CpaB [Evansella sp. AB-P1]MDG5788470.1 Flp pilus assembly protein CpaB [Evansella sp. AB-P1]